MCTNISVAYSQSTLLPLAGAVWFTFGSFFALLFSGMRVSHFILALCFGLLMLASNLPPVSEIEAGCFFVGEASSLSDVLFGLGLTKIVHHGVMGFFGTLAILTLVWIGQLLAGVIAHYLIPLRPSSQHRQLRASLTQIMGLLALLITFARGFVEQVISIVARGSEEKVFSFVLELGKESLLLASQGVILLLVPLAAVFISGVVFSIVVERIGESRSLTPALMTLRAPIVLLVFFASITAIDAYLQNSQDTLRGRVADRFYSGGG